MATRTIALAAALVTVTSIGALEPPGRLALDPVFLDLAYKGHAEDHFRVLDLNASVTTPYTASRHALLTQEWTPLEPGVIDHKLYVRGVGTVREQTAKGGDEPAVLVSVRHA